MRKPPYMQLLQEGIQAARNKRIGLAYLGAFAARADMAIITLFLILWVVQSADTAGLSTTDAQARAGMFVGVCSLAAVLWAPVFGILADRIDRLTLCILGFGLAAAGYGWLGSLDNVVSFASVIPVLILVGDRADQHAAGLHRSTRPGVSRRIQGLGIRRAGVLRRGRNPGYFLGWR